ncbi:MAG: hypothetical protein IT428_02820 [Planctomycetaceae bacterium]|nr:hypothetical protein [Planctomycetaceae bacterium]
MKAFDVWIRPLGENCRVRVVGMPNTTWLVRRLSEAFVFKTIEPIIQMLDSPLCTFKIPYNHQLSQKQFVQILKGIPEVTLKLEPA